MRLETFDETEVRLTASRQVVGTVRTTMRAPHINGADAEPSGFNVTKHELEQVARYWYWEQVDNYFHRFFYGQSGPYEASLSVYCAMRINVISPALGTARMQALCAEANEVSTGARHRR